MYPRGDRCVYVLLGRDGGLEEAFLGLAVEDPDDPVLADRRDQISLHSVHGATEDRTDLREIPVVLVVRDQLVVPTELAGADAERDDGVRV